MASSSYQGRRTTCSFCPTIVPLGDPERNGRDSGVEKAKRREQLKSLCHQLQASREYFLDIPEDCSEVMFPFCNNCEELVAGIWREDAVMQQAKAEIEKKMSILDQIVVDGELLRTKLPEMPPSLGFVENQKGTKLKDFILERYRNKLAARFHLPTNASVAANTQTGFASSQPIDSGVYENDEEETLPNRWDVLANKPSEAHHAINVGLKQELNLQEAEDVTVNIDPMDYRVGGQLPEDLGSNSLNHRLNPFQECYDDNDRDYEECQNAENEEDDPAYSQDSQFRAHYNDTNCTLVVSPPVEVAVKGTTAISKDAALIQIKQEACTYARNQMENEDDDSDHDSIFELVVTRRRVLFEGVEIYKATRHGSGSREKSEYLQCSLCSYTLEFPKGSKSRIQKAKPALYLKMKWHILSSHRGTGGGRLSNKKKLRKNKKPENNINKTLECDICGRPVVKLLNLLKHKFSHKNDEERMAAFAAGERGSNRRLLSNKLKVVPDPTPKRSVNVKSKAKVQDNKKVKEAKSGSLSSTIKRSTSGLDITIKSAACGRTVSQRDRNDRSKPNREAFRLKRKTSGCTPPKARASGKTTSSEKLQRRQNGRVPVPTTSTRTFPTATTRSQKTEFGGTASRRRNS
ncbi:unnamed protein product [Orchesella dallaii]|uniref:C2H2-type domain-containing protein n=1 Tax=Orchesella dallaii TaxID=48710 RepID=A0ABP1QBP5_9HEXA